jgi:hypothetical protein
MELKPLLVISETVKAKSWRNQNLLRTSIKLRTHFRILHRGIHIFGAVISSQSNSFRFYEEGRTNKPSVHFRTCLVTFPHWFAVTWHGLTFWTWQAAVRARYPLTSQKLEFFLRPTDSRPVHLGIGPPFGAHDQIYISLLFWTEKYFFFFLWHPLWRENGSVVYSAYTHWSGH